MNAGQTVFLDTTIQARRALADPSQSAELEARLAAPTMRAITASYVWMEYQRTIVADYAHVHRLMCPYTDWGTLLTHLLNGQRSFRPRAAVRCTRIVGKALRQSYKDWGLARQMLGEQITHGLRQQFWTHITPLPDPIACTLVQRGITRQLDGAYTVADTCRKETADCRLPEFLAAHSAELQTIAAYLVAHPHAIKDQERVQELLRQTQTDPRAVLGQAACWPLGDVIILLSAPPDAALWSLDPDFIPLSEALGRVRYEPPA